MNSRATVDKATSLQLIIATDPTCPPVPAGYRFMRDTDIFGFDIDTTPSTQDVARLAQACNERANCKSFNSNGYLKTVDSSDAPTSVWKSPTCGGIYFKIGKSISV